MANNINKFEVVGNVGKDGGAFDDAKGTEGLGTFSLAYNHPVRKAEDGTYPQSKTSWFRIKAWGKLGEVAGRLKKGQRVRVLARLEQNVWKDKKGLFHYDIDIIAENIQLISDIPLEEPQAATLEVTAETSGEEEVTPKARRAPKAKGPARTGVISKDGVPVKAKAPARRGKAA